MINLAIPPVTYDRDYTARVNRELDRRARETRNKNQDIELDKDRLILKSPNGTRWALQVSDTGVVSATPV